MANPAFKLEDAGFTREQVDALSDWVDGSAATKADIERLNGKIDNAASELRSEMVEMRGELKADISDLRGELKADISDLRGEFRAEMKDVRKELQYLKWIGGFIFLAIAGELLATFIK